MKMEADGAIRVQPGDSIAKYCSAIYGLPPASTRQHWGEFGHLRGSYVEPLADPNKIRAGDVLYHIPTFENAEIVVRGSAWPQMRFRIIGKYVKINVSVASAMYVRGQLQVKFSHQTAIYYWNTHLIFALTDPVPFSVPGHDVGVVASDWSQALEFDFHSFDPISHWADHTVHLECLLGRMASKSVVQMYLKWATPKQYVVRKAGGTPLPGFHVTVPKLTFETVGANPFPNFDAGPSLSFELRNFRARKDR